MRYKKGEFTTVPNTRMLQNVSATAQALFVWICMYSDDDGICFPSRATLAKNLNCSVRTVDTYIAELTENGFIQKTNRFYDNEKISNEYQILIIEGGRAKSALGRAKNDTTPRAKSAHRTKPNITKPIISKTKVLQNEEIRVVIEGKENKPKKQADHIVEVYRLFKDNYPANWKLNKTQRQAAENLYSERGIDQITKALEFYEEVKGEHFCPSIRTPYDLDSKWFKLIDFKKKYYGD